MMHEIMMLIVSITEFILSIFAFQSLLNLQLPHKTLKIHRLSSMIHRQPSRNYSYGVNSKIYSKKISWRTSGIYHTEIAQEAYSISDIKNSQYPLVIVF